MDDKAVSLMQLINLSNLRRVVWYSILTSCKLLDIGIEFWIWHQTTSINKRTLVLIKTKQLHFAESGISICLILEFTEFAQVQKTNLPSCSTWSLSCRLISRSLEALGPLSEGSRRSSPAWKALTTRIWKGIAQKLHWANFSTKPNTKQC